VLRITFNLSSSLNVKDQVSHPHTTAQKTTVLYISIFIFLDGRREGETILNWMTASISGIQFVFNFYVKWNFV
jgi:hypothetical protein